ncbi:MAG: hypothetical protein AMJ75_00375 [Phycisphaerae bacterium SM1_79]|nr:MAG: hypothetical protein AMJ75_00375 [Phycisphaerae bacterium SM1_79]
MAIDLANQHYFGLRGMRGECGEVTVSADATSGAITVATALSKIQYAEGHVDNTTIHSCQKCYWDNAIDSAGSITLRRIGCFDKAGTLRYIVLGH